MRRRLMLLQGRLIAPLFQHDETARLLVIAVQLARTAGFGAAGRHHQFQRRLQGGLMAGFGHQRGNNYQWITHIFSCSVKHAIACVTPYPASMPHAPHIDMHRYSFCGGVLEDRLRPSPPLSWSLPQSCLNAPVRTILWQALGTGFPPAPVDRKSTRLNS